MSQRSPRQVAPEERADLGALVALVLACAVIGGVGLFHTWMRLEALERRYALSEAASELAALHRESELLRLEVATLKAPARVERLARERLGLVPPAPSEVVVIEARAQALLAPHRDRALRPPTGVLAAGIEVPHD